MSKTYCDPNCRFCTYNHDADRWELSLALPVRDDHDPPTLTEDGVLATLVHPATEIVARPKCHGSGRVIILAAKPEEGD